MTNLEQLLARLEAATGPDTGLNIDLWNTLTREQKSKAINASSCEYTASIDAAIAFKEAVLPGALYSLAVGKDGAAMACLGRGEWEGIAHAPSLPLAICFAVVNVLIQEGKLK